MGNAIQTAITLGASLVSRSRRKKTLQEIQRRNAENRNILDLGPISPGQLLGSATPTGNLCISGGSRQARREVLMESLRQANDRGLPAVLLHQGDRRLEQLAAAACAGRPNARVLNAGQPFYEPLSGLVDTESALLLASASPAGQKIDGPGAVYLRAMCRLLRQNGTTPYVRCLAACPHGGLQAMVVEQERAGRMTPTQAAALRDDLAAGRGSRPDIECFLAQLTAESQLLADRDHLTQSTSIYQTVCRGGALCIDMGAAEKQAQTALLLAELRRCLAAGLSCRVLIDADGGEGLAGLLGLLKGAPGHLSWTLSTPDLGALAGPGREELAGWLGRAQTTVLFSHGQLTAQRLSAELGEYDHIELTQSHSGSNSFGQFGLHFAATNNVSTVHRRERAVKPEALTMAQDRAFLLLDRDCPARYTGVLL